MSLTQEIATLTQEVADLDASREKATEMRTAEKAANKGAVEDSQAAQKAVAAATAVMKDFYEKASLATGLLQTGVSRPTMGSDEWEALANPNFEGTIDKGHKAGQQTFGKKFTGQQDQAGGVMAMLEVVLSDFSNEEAECNASEAKAQETFDDFMTESKRTKATKLKKIEMDEADKAAAESKLQEDTKDMKG